ncbi:GNS1/SUR4 family-domain-containing protein [Tribonema minus]|uniref:Elongation of fatty acids protein n=1 Tax=Tribonema minus TaxID=303371 RepID=A0A835ZI52_9STRA|nr:GNS1/SUR4 family-domain-containing protein [Tribonema minus]
MAQLRKVSPTYPVTVCIIYLIGVYLGRRAMRNRKAFDLRGPLVVWNLALAVFSLWGALRTVPHVFYVLYKEGYTYTIIADGRDWCGGGAVGVWALWFVYSKTPELGDTVFIILRKKPLIFLHWYHHVTVLLYCWHSYYYQEAYGLYFAAMNYSVHAVMYLYYALAAVKIRLCKPYYITAMQISQMFMGIFVCGSAWYYYEIKGHNKYMHKGNLWAGAIMYSSYAALFLQYFVGRFVRKLFKSDKGKGLAAVKANGKGDALAASTEGSGQSANGNHANDLHANGNGVQTNGAYANGNGTHANANGAPHANGNGNGLYTNGFAKSLKGE